VKAIEENLEEEFKDFNIYDSKNNNKSFKSSLPEEKRDNDNHKR